MTKRNVSILLATLLVMAGAVIAGSGRNSSEIPAPPAIGATIEEFTLPDVDGRDHALKSLKGKNGTVLIFISVQCPVSNAYNERMEKLAADYKSKGIAVVGVNANSTEDAGAVKAHATEKGLTFTILKDPGNKLADKLGATRTPEAYFLDSNNKLLYHGRIDNSQNPAAIESSDLRTALDAALAGKPIEKTEAKAFGCTIKRA
ncbi:MAG TPA: thioredoxin family protein [Pyrinomonadaceae bacterium]|jgi:peroxiredoxin|nr:thioredoxin family protein [Pyrinomonadaceae bacterium]